MNLTAYSDSESDGEAPAPAPKLPSHRIVDRSDSGRIKLNLPAASRSQAANNDTEDGGPPAKKPRIGGGGAFGGFNSMLPAPKKPAAKATLTAEPGKRGQGSGLGVGVNLKTGAEPAFQRGSARVELDEYDENGNPIKKQPMNKSDFRALLNLPPPKTEASTRSNPEPSVDASQPETQQAPKPAAPRFVPMSVGKGKKKKLLPPRTTIVRSTNDESRTTSVGAILPSVTEAKPVSKPKVSLFGVSQAAPVQTQAPSDEQYQPFLADAEDSSMTEDGPDMQSNHFATQNAPAPAPVSNELTNIASELNLSEAERRQLFGKKGRGGPDLSTASIVEFNTDTEYAHNERLRQQGEQIQHNPLKSFSGAGKNSLRSLVSQATTQKDALEDHFSEGHRNKREAGNRYGW